MSFFYNAISVGIGYVAATLGRSPAESAAAGQDPIVQTAAVAAAQAAAQTAGETAAATGNPGEQNAAQAAVQIAAAARTALEAGLPPPSTSSSLSAPTNSSAIGIAIVEGVTNDRSVQDAISNSNSSSSSQYESVRNRTSRMEADAKARKIEEEARRRPTTTGSAASNRFRSGEAQANAKQTRNANIQERMKQNAKKIRHVSAGAKESLEALSSGELTRGQSGLEIATEQIRVLKSHKKDIDGKIQIAKDTLHFLPKTGLNPEEKQQKEDLEFEIANFEKLRAELDTKISEMTKLLPTHGGTRRHRRNYRRNHRKTRYRR